MLCCENLTVGVSGRALVAGLDLALAPGDRIALLGPNGTGKTRALLTLAGLAPPLSGRVLVDGQPVTGWRRRDLARRLGMLLQEDGPAFPGTVLDVALLGRFPHHGPWSAPGATDRDRTREALAAMGLAGLAERDHGTLSGGERRRLAIARLLAQAPPLLLLDEPFNHLDPAHVVAVLGALRRRTDTGEAGVVLSLHDATLARRFAREAILLFGDGRWERGPVDAILTPPNLERLFGTRYAAYHGADGELLFPAA
jgi:iron complex transport system ATP-binding protein